MRPIKIKRVFIVKKTIPWVECGHLKRLIELCENSVLAFILEQVKITGKLVFIKNLIIIIIISTKLRQAYNKMDLWICSITRWKS